ncbi:MAG TPA: hypothetical protein VF618_15240 [Thermoanaerobaculia bacterium]
MNLEKDLARALRRERPAPGFAGRVMQRIETQPEPRVRPHWWRTIAASLTLTAVLGGWAAHEVYEQRRLEGERARDQVVQALRIANEKVRYAQDEVREIGSTHNE